MTPDEIQICYWPAGTWCYRHELEQMTHMSDDFARTSLPAETSEDQISAYVEEAVHSRGGESIACIIPG